MPEQNPQSPLSALSALSPQNPQNPQSPLEAGAVARDLELARARTTWLTELDEQELFAQHSPIMSPLVWDLAHISQQEELWLIREGDATRAGLLPPGVDALYDAFTQPRAIRSTLPLLPPVEARRYGREVRGRVLDALDRATDVFPYAMVVQHEEQHDETMLATLQLRAGASVLSPTRTLPPGRRVTRDAVLVPAGEFVLGVDVLHEPTSLDNERPAHVVDVPAFRIGRVPVTNAEWQAFIEAGGYIRPELWSDRGWQHRQEAGLERPMAWHEDGSRTRFGVREDVPADEPVQHVTHFEAEAFARWSGARLPTEVEWEKACAWDPVAGRRRRWPWGDSPPTPELANLGGGALRPAPVGALPAGASAYGVEQLIGDVWEWTSSGFEPWPGFSPMLYAQYSAPFFGGDYRVLRGGSWATAASTVRPSFRNWDHPFRRQIFTGVRLAWDA
ncbi:ergothioneine biosynthesis protein EgtB [Phycicoccus sp. Soil748]|uniref:ergothioneine biosynthesis protein EgtB n=1 Tax=Phycicoccus sp. Soil748 TaxID=1736397 RepID=UPI0009E7C2A5|nr:ergothioneine biosynthesis protein EgtB [Phycicoccus sp. Soil748]